MAHHLAWKDFPFAPQLYIFLRHLMAREVAPRGQGPPELGQGLVCCTDMKVQKGKVLPSRSKPCRKLQPLLSTCCTEFCCCPSEGSLLLSGDPLGPAAALPQTWQREGWSCNPHLDDDVMVFFFLIAQGLGKLIKIDCCCFPPMCILRSCFLPKVHLCTCSQSQVTGAISHEVCCETGVGWSCLFAVCGTQFTSPQVFACIWGLAGYPARVLQRITCFTSCENRYSPPPVLQSLNFYKEHFVSKETTGLLKENQVSVPSCWW